MKDSDRLIEAFIYIKRIFFRRWDKECVWSVDLDSHLPSACRCDHELKKIVFKFLPRNQNRLYLRLIHEIVHVWVPYHNKKWQSRLLKASQKAISQGNKILAEYLKMEVDLYIEARREGRKLSANLLYSMISDEASKYPYDSYETNLSRVSSELGLYPKDIIRRYKRCRKMFNQALKKSRNGKLAKLDF